MTHPVKAPKKLIEVALPLDAINVASAREKSIRHGHPSTLHLWWARRPLATARAVIFSQMVNDPSWKWELEHAGKIPPNNLKGSWAASRKRLFKIIEDLVLWKNTTNEEVLEKAREEIRKSWRETCELNKDHPDAATLFDPKKLPGLHDPFAGGGAIPLEAQRLGLEAYASDLNPVAVLINKAMVEIPPKFAGKPPVNPDVRKDKKLFSKNWTGAEGLANDVRYYGKWMRNEAEKRIGLLYPKVEVTNEMAKDRPDLKPLVGQKLTVIAWLWARTVKSPNPAFSHVDVPLASTFWLSTKEGKEAYVEPVIARDGYVFRVRVGKPNHCESVENGTKLARGANFKCLMSGAAIESSHVYGEAIAGRMGASMMAVVAELARGRAYLPVDDAQLSASMQAQPTWKPDLAMPDNPRWFSPPLYGLKTYGDLFTPRQLASLTTFVDLVRDVHNQARNDALNSGLADDNRSLKDGGTGAQAYADSVAVYLSEVASKITSYHCTMAVWRADMDKSGRAFGRQALPMVWDFAECNPFAGAGGDWEGAYEDAAKVICTLGKTVMGQSQQYAAQRGHSTRDARPVISTDPPYYDNVGYADLSDFFYVWLRRALRDILPDLFATMAVPKAEELVATPYRHGTKEAAENFFLQGMSLAVSGLAHSANPAVPLTIYYAFKQSESDDESGQNNTGWETFLEAVLRAGLGISGTWPMRTEQSAALKSKTNSLASSIVLVCRPRAADAPTIARREFQRELNQVLPEALDEMTRGAGDDVSPVAPVDLSQAIIGPGMAVFSKYAAVLEADGKPMTVHTALQLINRFLAEDDFDADTQFSLRWFEQHGWENGQFGEADTLARSKATSVDGLKQAGVVLSSAGKVRLLKWSEYPTDWNPETDDRLPIWEVLHHLIRALKQDGESSAGRVLAAVQAKSEAARQLAYRLYTLCERTGKAEDARAYNELVTSWTAIESAAAAEPAAPKRDTRDMFKKQGNKP